MLALFLALALPITTYNVLFEKKTYEATATLFVDSTPEEYSFMKDWIPGSDIPLQMAVLRSRSLAEVVVDSLPRESIDELLKETMYRDYVLDASNWIRRLLGRELVVYSPKERAVMELQNARTIFSVKGPTGTTFSVKGSQVEIRTIATRPKVAMDLANTYVEILLNRSRSYVREEARAAREFLEGQLAQAQETLKHQEEQFAKARRAGGLPLAHRSELELTRLAQAEAGLAEAQLAKKFAQSRFATLRAQLDRADKGEPIDKRLRERLAQLEERLALLAERYTDDHPVVIATRSEIREMRQRVDALPPEPPRAERRPPADPTLPRQVSDLEIELAALRAKEDMLEQRVVAIKRGLSGPATEELEQARLNRAADSQRNFTSLLMDKLTAARIREQGEVKSLRIIDLATLPMVPSGSRTAKQIGFGLLVSLALSLGLGGLLEFFRDPIETEDDVQRVTGLPVLGCLPGLDVKHGGNGAVAGPNLWSESPRPTVFAERCRGLASLLEALQKDRPLQSLLIASAAPEEGKSTLLVNLAWACSGLGKRLLLVDSDLRRPALTRMLGLPDGPGLTDVLGTTDGGDGLLVPFREGVEVLRSGGIHPAAQSLLTRAAAARLVDRLRARADLVLFDSAPLNAVADNLHLAAEVDAVILVARAGETEKHELVRVKAELDKFGARILGVVLNGLSAAAVKHYYGKYYSYYVNAPSRERGWRILRPWARAEGRVSHGRFMRRRKRGDHAEG